MKRLIVCFGLLVLLFPLVCAAEDSYEVNYASAESIIMAPKDFEIDAAEALKEGNGHVLNEDQWAQEGNLNKIPSGDLKKYPKAWDAVSTKHGLGKATLNLGNVVYKDGLLSNGDTTLDLNNFNGAIISSLNGGGFTIKKKSTSLGEFNLGDSKINLDDFQAGAEVKEINGELNIILSKGARMTDSKGTEIVALAKDTIVTLGEDKLNVEGIALTFDALGNKGFIGDPTSKLKGALSYDYTDLKQELENGVVLLSDGTFLGDQKYLDGLKGNIKEILGSVDPSKMTLKRVNDALAKSMDEKYAEPIKEYQDNLEKLFASQGKELSKVQDEMKKMEEQFGSELSTQLANFDQYKKDLLATGEELSQPLLQYAQQIEEYKDEIENLPDAAQQQLIQYLEGNKAIEETIAKLSGAIEPLTEHIETFKEYQEQAEKINDNIKQGKRLANRFDLPSEMGQAVGAAAYFAKDYFPTIDYATEDGVLQTGVFLAERGFLPTAYVQTQGTAWTLTGAATVEEIQAQGAFVLNPEVPLNILVEASTKRGAQASFNYLSNVGAFSAVVGQKGFGGAYNSENAKAEVTVSPNGDFNVKGGAEIAGQGSLVAEVEMKDENLVAGASYQTKIGDSVTAEVNANYGSVEGKEDYSAGFAVQATW
ncbi:hypothetical protein HOE37_00480 [Candidatus Woesearchaeota archaeon]|nr:hypothetical protein [Candidatus Woesearchaeota archaeon]MBT4336165.1 hypothetical protein [Candidatus Woesearchaeota archaeon]MBT4468856.1 hypothetical protein [Candidatus Woesearchaeota archaeon]MBT6744825.1 hypothetical protein [Candidatus Woesearchaeota archaeon]